MPEPPDLDALARRYLDLWQDHLRGLASDGDVAEITARTVELMNSGLAAWTATTGAGDRPRDGATPDSEPKDAPRVAAAGPAPGHPDHDLGGLVHRIEALERRIAELEAGAGRGRGGARRRPGKRRS